MPRPRRASHFARHAEVRRRARAGAGSSRRASGIFVDPGALQGLRRVRRGLRRARPRRAVHGRQGPTTERGRRETTLDRARSATCAFFRSLPPTPPELPEREGAGRPDARRARPRLRRRGRLVRRLRRGDRHPDDGRRHPPGPRPGVDGHRRRDRLQHRLRQHLSRSTRTWCRGRTRCSRTPRRSRSASARGGTRTGHPDRKLWVIGGDGAMYDIGFQSLSRMVASGADIKVLVLDTQVYSNTGGQASTASFGGQITKMSAFGAVEHGRPEAAQGARPDPDGARQRLRGPDHARPPQPLLPVGPRGERVSRARRSSSPTRRACRSTASPTTRRRARRSWPSTRGRSRSSPTTRGAGETIAERLSLQGNPALRDDWSKLPDRRAGRLPRLRPIGGPVRAALRRRTATPSAEIEATQADRLANWRTLQELAGLRTGGA